jgi:putative endonuclease
MLHMKQKVGKSKCARERESKKKLDADADRRTTKRKIGDLGENIACRFLVKRGFSIIGRNYLEKCGEIDIIAQKDNQIHFVEVKTVSHLPFSRETDYYRPEDNAHPAKLTRLVRTIQVYLAENNVPCETIWQIDLVTVYVDLTKNRQYIEIMENVIP